jgi:hypothetical protein
MGTYSLVYSTVSPLTYQKTDVGYIFQNKPYQLILLYYSVAFHSNVSFHSALYFLILSDKCTANSLPLMASIPFYEAFQVQKVKQYTSI